MAITAVVTPNDTPSAVCKQKGGTLMKAQCKTRKHTLGGTLLQICQALRAYQQSKEERAHAEDVGLSRIVPWQLNGKGTFLSVKGVNFKMTASAAGERARLQLPQTCRCWGL